MLFNAWAEVFKERREELGITQETVVGRMPSITEPNTFGRWERGEVPPSPQFFDEIAHALELSPEELGRRYSQALYNHYHPEIGEVHAAYGGSAAEAILAAVNLEGLPAELQAHLLRQRDNLRSQASGLKLISEGLEAQISSFAATVSRLRATLGSADAGSPLF